MSERTLKERARDELRNYAVVAVYLYVCFAVLMLYESTLLQKEGAGLVLHGLAAIKALVLGKFILIGEALAAGSRLQVGTLARRIASRSLLLLVVLIVLSVVEELVVGRVHGQSLAETVAGYEQRSPIAMLAKCLLMLLILVPLVAVKELNRTLGPGVLRQMLFDSAR
ncbi:MAG: hypothetical protein NDI84_01175 [Steroidobacteraceae bacterium]|nr:hypothetical protein [Steroidobacteraceae bacterium]